MQNRTSLSWVLVLACTLIMLVSYHAFAVEYVVHEGESILGAVLLTEPGDVILIECGSYLESNLLLPDNVTLKSVSGDPDCVTIFTNGWNVAVSLFQATRDTRIEGITFARSPEYLDKHVERGGAVHLRESSPTFENCRFENFEAVYGGAVFCKDGSNPLFLNCVFRGNRARAVGGAIACVDDCEVSLENCLVYDNEAGSTGGAFSAARNSHVGISRTTVANNTVGGVASSSAWSHSDVVVVGSIISEANLLVADNDGFYKADCSNVHDGSGLPPVDPSFGYFISEDPLFCMTLAGDHKFNLDEASPCTPEAVPDCEGMGAMPVGCAMSSVDPPPFDSVLPLVTRLQDAYPNPFNPRTTIAFDLAKSGQVSVGVFDLAGRLVNQLLDESVAAGHHKVTWQGRDSRGQNAAAGVYFVRLKAANITDTRRMTLVK